MQKTVLEPKPKPTAPNATITPTGNTHMDNIYKMRQDTGFLNSELQRANSVIAERQQSGQDITAQQKYINTINEINTNNHGGKGIIQPTAQTTNSAPNLQSYIDQLNNARKQQALAGLDKSRNQALSNLQQEKSEIQPRYYDARNQTAAGNQQQARNFAEFMASRGGTNSGANAQAEISQQGVFQANIGSLNRQENQAFDNIARRTTDVNNAYESDLASANAGIEAERMQALINQMNADRQFGLQEGGLMGIYNGQQTLAGQGQAFNQNMANQQFNYQQQRDSVGDQRWDQQFNYQQGRDQVGDIQWQQQFDLSRKGQEFGQNMTQQQFAYQQARDQISDEWRKKEFDEDVRRFGLNYALDKQRASKSSSGGGGAYEKALADFMSKMAADEFKRQQEYISKNAPALQQGSGLVNRPMDYLLKNRQQITPTFTGNIMDQYAYLRK